MRLILAVKRVESKFTEEGGQAANPKECLKIVRGKVCLEKTRKWLDMSKPATEEDDEDVEFVDDYKSMLSRFTKFVSEAEKNKMMTTAVSKRRQRNGSTASKKEEKKDGKETVTDESLEEDSDTEGRSVKKEAKGQAKGDRDESGRHVGERANTQLGERSGPWRCFNSNGVGHEAWNCPSRGKGKGMGKGWDKGGEGHFNNGKGFGKGFGKGKGY